MMWRSISRLLLLGIVLSACRDRKQETWSYRRAGYYYRLLSFQEDTFTYRPGYMARVAVAFKTQSDSVFWDSFNNLGDRFFIRIDSGATHNYIRHFASGAAVHDSACLLVRPADFFLQQFGSGAIPFFSKGDTAVKIYIKLKQVLSRAEFETLSHNLQQAELNQAEAYFGSPQQFELARDPDGFYWVTRPQPSEGPAIAEGDQVLLAYTGYFLNGRLLEQPDTHFEYIYGTPDQLLKGLNYVTGKLKLGQTAKILLPSRLAFGENGSSNGAVPPYTPLIYELKIIDVKKPK